MKIADDKLIKSAGFNMICLQFSFVRVVDAPSVIVLVYESYKYPVGHVLANNTINFKLITS